MSAKGSTGFWIPTASSSTQIEEIGYTPASGFRDIVVRSIGVGAAAAGTTGKILLANGGGIGLRGVTPGTDQISWGTGGAFSTSAAEISGPSDLDLFIASPSNNIQFMAASGTGTIVHRIGGAVGINVASFGNPNFGTNYLLSLTGPNVTVTSGTVNWCSLSPLGLADGGATSSTVARTLYVNPTINYTAASKTGNYEALTINAVETSLPTGTNYLLRLQAGASGGVDKAAFDNTGSLKFATIDASSATNTPVVKLNLTSPAIGNPTGTTSTTRVMMGMGSSVTLTPRSSGRVFVVATAVGRNNTSSDGVQIEIRYGTGVAPANGAALTGSSIGNFVNWSPGTGTPDTSMTVSGVAVGLSVGTAYWFDFGLAAIIGGTGSVVNVSYTVIEL